MTTTTTPLSGADALRLLEEVVAEKGSDYVYDRPLCVYIDDDADGAVEYDDNVPTAVTPEARPLCIVGHVFMRSGLYANPTIANVMLGNEVIHTDLVGDELSDDAIRVLRAAQLVQDGDANGGSSSLKIRGSWGDALEAARVAAADPDYFTSLFEHDGS